MTSADLSPYIGHSEKDWKKITDDLLKQHPLKKEEIIEVSIGSWSDILKSGIGAKPFKFGIDMFPSPQILSFLLHELIALELARRYPTIWRKDQKKDDKDLVCLADDKFSTEIKASSHASQVFGNRSYAQPRVVGGKSKNGFYITINFEQLTKENPNPDIKIIRFGWLDHVDWIAQNAASGQQARIRPEAYAHKLLMIYKK